MDMCLSLSMSAEECGWGVRRGGRGFTFTMRGSEGECWRASIWICVYLTKRRNGLMGRAEETSAGLREGRAEGLVWGVTGGRGVDSTMRVSKRRSGFRRRVCVREEWRNVY